MNTFLKLGQEGQDIEALTKLLNWSASVASARVTSTPVGKLTVTDPSGVLMV